MSFGGGYNGGRTRMSTKVHLNVYDLSPANQYLYPVGLGLHHSGVEILGTEYSFASGAGIFENRPQEAPGGPPFRERLYMGAFEGSSADLKRVLDDMRRDGWGPTDYNLVQRNCNHFANSLCWKLLNKALPGHVNRLADIGVCCKCLLPRQMLENAPVGDPNAPAGGSAGYTVLRPAGRETGNDNAGNRGGNSAFAGLGNRLGADSSNSRKQDGVSSSLLGKWIPSPASKGGTVTDQKESPQDVLTDRREKARKAALARLERQQQQQQQEKES